jgi:hypothetical protein
LNDAARIEEKGIGYHRLRTEDAAFLIDALSYGRQGNS